MAGCTQQQPLTVRLSDNPTYGKILTDSTGRSLYIQARDVPNTGAVANLGEVGRFYPPFYAESVIDGNGINVSEFGHISRADGKQQTTYRGWPLYYYLNDKALGEAKSQGANNITFLAKPDYTVMVHENVTRGVYLVDTTGAALLVLTTGHQSGPRRLRPVPGIDRCRGRRRSFRAPISPRRWGRPAGPRRRSGASRSTSTAARTGRERSRAMPADTSPSSSRRVGALTGNAEAPTAAPTPSRALRKAEPP